MKPVGQIVLLRRINLGATNRVPMAGLRESLAGAGFEGPGGGPVRTYVQSGNIAVQSVLEPSQLAGTVAALVAEEFGVVAPTVARSAAELRRLIELNPFPERADENPKTFQVSFLSDAISKAGREHIARRVALGEEVAVSESGLEVYAWHPGGIHTSKLASQLGEKKLGVDVATARNWSTVLACLQLLEAAD